MSVLEQFSLKNKVAVVIGGAGLLGPGIALALADCGAKVVIADIDEKKGLEVIKKNAKEVSFIAVDLKKEGSINSLMKKVYQQFGRLDVLVNTAIAVGRNHFGKVENYSIEDWDDVMAVNVRGVFLACRSAAEYMKKQKSGSIINFGSIYGVVGADQRIYGDSGINSPAVYAAAKGGVINLTRYFAAYWAPYGIRVNAISPGGVFNEQDPGFVEKYSARTPMGRMLNKDELKGAVVYLASQASSYVTGHNLLVDGGWTAW